MCAATSTAPIPLYTEAKQYWQRLTDECRQYIECFNATLAQNHVDPAGLLRCSIKSESTLQLSEPRLPSFNIDVSLNVRPWGPAIEATLYGARENGERFLPQDIELPIAIDGDHETVAIYDEGRSFSPHEVASYLMQYFHCCYPEVSFPC